MRIFLNILLIIILSSQLIAQNEMGSYEFVPKSKTYCRQNFPIDWNGDGSDEILELGECNININDGVSTTYWSYFIFRRYDHPWCFDNYSVHNFTLDKGKYRLILPFRLRDSIFAHIREGAIGGRIERSRTLFLSYRSKNEAASLPDGSGWLVSPHLLDVNDDGRRDLLGYWITWLPWKPQYQRGLAAYDLETGQEIWHYWLAGNISDDFIIHDLDGDGKDEIVVGTSAPSNGAAVNNTDDSHSYIVALDRKGRKLWQREMNGTFSFASVKIINALGRDVVLYWTQSWRSPFDRPDEIGFLQPKDGRLIKRIFCGKYISGLAVGDLDNDGNTDIITGNYDGVVRVYNDELEITKSFIYKPGVWVRVQNLVDMDGDDWPEVVATSEDGYLIAISHDMKLKACQQSTEISMHRMQAFRSGRKHLVETFKYRDSGFFDATLWELRRKPLVAKSNIWHWAIASVVLISLLSISWFSVLCWQRSRALMGAFHGFNNCGLITIGSNGKLKLVTQRAAGLLGIEPEKYIGSNAAEAPSLKDIWNALKDQKGGKNNYEILLENGRRVTASTTRVGGRIYIYLEDLEERENLNRMRYWAPVAQRMAHGIKTPLTTMLLAIQKIGRLNEKVGRNQEVESLCRSIEEEIERLRKSADSFMRFLSLETPSVSPSSIEKIINDLIKRRELNSSEHPVFVLRFEPGLPDILLDKAQIEMALENILDNAVAAAGVGGQVEIGVKTQEVIDNRMFIKKKIVIEIKDNGYGIPFANKNKLFQPFFTTKENGTGLGLVTSKKIIEDHGGQISIDSKEGVGTIVTILLPVAIG